MFLKSNLGISGALSPELAYPWKCSRPSSSAVALLQRIDAPNSAGMSTSSISLLLSSCNTLATSTASKRFWSSVYGVFFIWHPRDFNTLLPSSTTGMFSFVFFYSLLGVSKLFSSKILRQTMAQVHLVNKTHSALASPQYWWEWSKILTCYLGIVCSGWSNISFGIKLLSVSGLAIMFQEPFNQEMQLQ